MERKFHSQRCASEKTALARFKKVFGEDMDQEQISEMFKWYTKRLHECIRLKGQMTKYQKGRLIAILMILMFLMFIARAQNRPRILTTESQILR